VTAEGGLLVSAIHLPVLEFMDATRNLLPWVGDIFNLLRFVDIPPPVTDRLEFMPLAAWYTRDAWPPSSGD
jgi:hypothetical protein